MAKTREDWNLEAAALGIDAEGFANIDEVKDAIDAVRASQVDAPDIGASAEVLAHLRHPDHVPMPEGTVLNFGRTPAVRRSED